MEARQNLEHELIFEDARGANSKVRLHTLGH